jgi:hypothetical protein
LEGESEGKPFSKKGFPSDLFASKERNLNMAIKGLGYTKTSWAFEERPVASSKLNTWDDRIEAALELIYFLLSHAWGGGDGVVRGAAQDDLATQATATPGLSVDVQPGYAFIGRAPFKLAAATETNTVAPPTTNDRIDLVQISLETWNVTLITGTESPTPVAPVAGIDCLALAQLYLRPAMTTIKDTDDTTNGYIIDARVFI